MMATAAYSSLMKGMATRSLESYDVKVKEKVEVRE